MPKKGRNRSDRYWREVKKLKQSGARSTSTDISAELLRKNNDIEEENCDHIKGSLILSSLFSIQQGNTSELKDNGHIGQVSPMQSILLSFQLQGNTSETKNDTPIQQVSHVQSDLLTVQQDGNTSEATDSSHIIIMSPVQASLLTVQEKTSDSETKGSNNNTVTHYSVVPAELQEKAVDSETENNDHKRQMSCFSSIKMRRKTGESEIQENQFDSIMPTIQAKLTECQIISERLDFLKIEAMHGLGSEMSDFEDILLSNHERQEIKGQREHKSYSDLLLTKKSRYH